jgi:hypothetical protein
LLAEDPAQIELDAAVPGKLFAGIVEFIFNKQSSSAESAGGTLSKSQTIQSLIVCHFCSQF